MSMCSGEKIAIFDFCGTLANYQTFDPFLCFVLKKHRKGDWVLSKWVKNGLVFLNRFTLRFMQDVYFYKLLLVRETRGITEEQLYQDGKEYYEKFVRENIIKKTAELLQEYKQKGYRVWIVSAGSKYYIKDFAAEYGVDLCITAEIKMQDGVSTGKLSTDCMGERKVEVLAESGYNQWEVAVTDSLSDLPLLQRSKKKVVISQGRHQEWVRKDMEEIIWE